MGVFWTKLSSSFSSSNASSSNACAYKPFPRNPLVPPNVTASSPVTKWAASFLAPKSYAAFPSSYSFAPSSSCSSSSSHLAPSTILFARLESEAALALFSGCNSKGNSSPSSASATTTSTIVTPSTTTGSPSRISTRINLLASGMAAIVSTFCVQPLELIKTRLQVYKLCQNQHISSMSGHVKELLRSEGIRGLYRGVCPSLMSFVPSVSIYFTLYNEFKPLLGCPSPNGSAPKVLMLQSLSAGLASNCTAAITNPLWLIKTRIQTQNHSGVGVKYKHSFHALQSIVKEEGVRGLYKGLTASFLASSQAMIQFPLYEILKCLLAENSSSHLAAGAIASSMACTLTYPSEVVRSRLQVQGCSKGPPRYKGVFGAFRTIWREEGFRGMYRGLLASLIRIAPAQAIALTVYELILRTHTHWR